MGDAMTDDVRISVGLPGHPKTKKLRRRLKGEGCWSLVCLLLWTGKERWDGTLYGMTDEDIELAADWNGEPGAFVSALLEVRFLDGEPGLRAIHDWQEHNPYAASKGERIEKGKQAAAARWGNKKGRPAKVSDATGMPPACPPHATTIAEQCPPAPTPTQPLKAEAKATVRDKPAPTDAAFLAAWAMYPKRGGGNSRADALKSWNARVREGESEGVMMSGVVRYASYIAATGKERTEYVMQAVRFFGTGKHYQADWTPPADPIERKQPGKQLQGLMALEEMKNGLVSQRNHHGHPEIGGPRAGAPAIGGSAAGDRFGMAGGAGQRLALGHGNGRAEDSRGVLDLGPDSYFLAESSADA